MESVIIRQSKNSLLISWSKTGIGFGTLSMDWDENGNIYKLDAELVGIDTIIEIFKALE